MFFITMLLIGMYTMHSNLDDIIVLLFIAVTNMFGFLLTSPLANHRYLCFRGVNNVVSHSDLY